MANKPKKGRNPATVDNWLDALGLYRKNVAYDETCLFRAVSEQLFQCQIYHERVRKECVQHGRNYFYDFLEFHDSEEQWFDHLDLLEKHMVVCGNIEMQLVSHKYNCDVIVYDAVHQKVINVTQRDLEKSLTLCLMSEDHYDVVHQKEHIQNVGFCQSMVYSILYENVFKITRVQDIVQGMLYDKEFVSLPFTDGDLKVKEEKDDSNVGDDLSLLSVSIAPFPFKVAKALDPTIYRNIEYDAWTEIRRELRLGDWYYGDDNLILGTRCILNDANDTYECYIQEIIKNENKCVVYITKLAEKRTVNYTDLSPENDAKPWPLPYRFTKNLVVTSSQNVAPEKLKLPKKRKDKRKIKNESQTVNTLEQIDPDIDAFIGVPLQMKNGSAQDTPPETPLSQHNLLITPEISSPLAKFSWESPWHIPSGSPDKFAWSQASGTSPKMPNYNAKPMVAAVPVTPNVVPYHDPQYPFVYNYPVENYNAWANSNNDYAAQNNQYPLESEESKEKIDNYEEAQGYAGNYEPPPAKERPPLTIPPPNPQIMEVFSPVLPIHPGTPVIYTHPTAEVADLVMPPAPFQVYTPPVDLQYVSPAPYFYSPTIPTTWYPVGINSQGFIFPPPVNQNMQSN